jgi:hypothetical protein
MLSNVKEDPSFMYFLMSIFFCTCISEERKVSLVSNTLLLMWWNYLKPSNTQVIVKFTIIKNRHMNNVAFLLPKYVIFIDKTIDKIIFMAWPTCVIVWHPYCSNGMWYISWWTISQKISLVIFLVWNLEHYY